MISTPKCVKLTMLHQIMTTAGMEKNLEGIVFRDILSIFVLINLAAADPTQTSIANFKCLLLHSNFM